MEPVKLEWAARDISSRLRSIGHAATDEQIQAVMTKLACNLVNHNVHEDLLGRAIKDVGAHRLATIAPPPPKAVS